MSSLQGYKSMPLLLMSQADEPDFRWSTDLLLHWHRYCSCPTFCCWVLCVPRDLSTIAAKDGGYFRGWEASQGIACSRLESRKLLGRGNTCTASTTPLQCQVPKIQLYRRGCETLQHSIPRVLRELMLIYQGVRVWHVLLMSNAALIGRSLIYLRIVSWQVHGPSQPGVSRTRISPCTPAQRQTRSDLRRTRGSGQQLPCDRHSGHQALATWLPEP